MSISSNNRRELRRLIKEFEGLDKPTQAEELKVWAGTAVNIMERDRKDRMTRQGFGLDLNGR